VLVRGGAEGQFLFRFQCLQFIGKQTVLKIEVRFPLNTFTEKGVSSTKHNACTQKIRLFCYPNSKVLLIK